MHCQGREQPDANNPLGIKRFPGTPGLVKHRDPKRTPQHKPWQPQFDGHVGKQVVRMVKIQI
ncbi:hypothetical protein D3C76_1427600 [compost metagenome]